MNTIQLAPSEAIISNRLFFGTTEQIKYLWKNLILEKRVSVGRLSKIFRRSAFGAFWVVLSSPVD